MRKHEALMREAEITKARSGAFWSGAFVGVFLTISVVLLAATLLGGLP